MAIAISSLLITTLNIYGFNSPIKIKGLANGGKMI